MVNNCNETPAEWVMLEATHFPIKQKAALLVDRSLSPWSQVAWEGSGRNKCGDRAKHELHQAECHHWNIGVEGFKTTCSLASQLHNNLQLVHSDFE